jgi:hypothetical protein
MKTKPHSVKEDVSARTVKKEAARAVTEVTSGGTLAKHVPATGVSSNDALRSGATGVSSNDDALKAGANLK